MDKEKLKKIMRSAEREKFGRGSDNAWSKRMFLDGVKFCIGSIDGGKEVLTELGYKTD